MPTEFVALSQRHGSESRPATHETYQLFRILISKSVPHSNPVVSTLPLISCSANATLSLDIISIRTRDAGKLGREKGHSSVLNRRVGAGTYSFANI